MDVSVLSGEVELNRGSGGAGVFVDASLAKVEVGVGPVGAKADLNVNTGWGVRGGNAEVHLLGLGGKIGRDGVAVDTPVGGVKCCVM